MLQKFTEQLPAVLLTALLVIGGAFWLHQQTVKEMALRQQTELAPLRDANDALKASNQALQTKFGITGYPTVIVLDADGKELSKEVGFNGASADDYVKKLKKLKH
jgi:thioredoxin-related protein